MKLTVVPNTSGKVIIELDFFEALGLYKMALAVNHPDDNWAQIQELGRDEDVEPLAAAIQVNLAELVGP